MRTCPTCKRATRPQHTTAEEFPGTILAMKQDGTCLTCLRKHNGWQHGGARVKRVSREAGGHSAATVLDVLRARRAARGVPEQGLPAIKIANTKGRIIHVPQAEQQAS